MILFNRKMTAILTALILCAITFVAAQPVPAPVDPKVKTPPIPGDERQGERAEKLKEKFFPDGRAHDFGKVQFGTQVYHAFRIVNKSNVPLKLTQVRLSMGSRSLHAWTTKHVLQPEEEGKVEVAVNTRMFVGLKNHTIYVTLDNGKLWETRLWLQTCSVENLAFFPDSVDFGKIAGGEAPTRHMIVTVPGQPKLQVTKATCESKYIHVKVEELARGTTTAIYKVSATVQAKVPIGKLDTEVELSTNNPDMPKLFVPVSVQVEAPK